MINLILSLLLFGAIAFISCDARNVVKRTIQKREEGNPCQSAEKPFPCKNSDKCIPINYLCDDNPDCDDFYDEDPDVCTAAIRPPVEEIQQFLESEKSWIKPKLFNDKPLELVAHSLATSQTVNDFRKKLGMSPDETGNLCRALDGVRDGREEALESLGMQPKAWNEVVFFFSKLLKSDFKC